MGWAHNHMWREVEKDNEYALFSFSENYLKDPKSKVLLKIERHIDILVHNSSNTIVRKWQ